VGTAFGTHGRGDKIVHGFGGKARRKVTTRKTKAEVRGWDQNGSWRDWLGVWIGFDWLKIGTGGNLL
jgi:hypothetical protein